MKACLDAAARPERRPLLILGMAALLLALATVGVYRLLPRYEREAREYLVNPAFDVARGESIPEGWEVEGDPAGIEATEAGIRLTNHDPAGGIGLVQVIERQPGDASVFDVYATTGTENVSGGRRFWRGARLTVSIPREGEIARGRNKQLANLQGNRSIRHYRQRFTFGSGVERIEIALRLRHATGTLVVRDLQVVPLVERTSFRIVAGILRLSWTAVALGALFLGLRQLPTRRQQVAVLGFAVLAACILLMPETQRDGIARLVSSSLAGRIEPDESSILGHFLLFAVAGLALFRLRLGLAPWRILLLLCVLAGFSELAQFMADARSPDFDDWVVDTAGAAVGLLTALAVERARPAR